MNDKQIAEFYRRSYTVVDGLWFMKVEEKYGFDTALEIDNEVWKVFPKMQARALKSILKMEKGMDALFECIKAKFAVDGFTFETEKAGDDGGFRIIINKCPWHGVMVESGREHLSDRVGAMVCNTENAVWAAEFGDSIRFELPSRICAGAESCILQFSK